jgi:superfamily II DNA/RNA helicase
MTAELGLQNVEWVVVDEADLLQGMFSVQTFKVVPMQFYRS